MKRIPILARSITTSCLLFAAGILSGHGAQAQEFYAGPHVGALATTGTGDTSAMAYGIHLGVNPYGWAAFQLDATLADLSGTYFSSSPAIVVYPVNYEEFQLGFLGGAGFYKFPNQSTKFGTSIGVTGDFKISQLISVGMESRYHPIFGNNSPNLWTVFLTLNFHFQGDGGW